MSDGLVGLGVFLVTGQFLAMFMDLCQAVRGASHNDKKKLALQQQARTHGSIRAMEDVGLNAIQHKGVQMLMERSHAVRFGARRQIVNAHVQRVQREFETADANGDVSATAIPNSLEDCILSQLTSARLWRLPRAGSPRLH